MSKSKKIKKNQKRGFTLIEILVVSTIIIVVSAMGLVSYSNAQVKARDAQRAKDLENVRTSLLLFRTEYGYYPIAGVLIPSRVTFSFPRQVMARIANTFKVQEAQAVLNTGYTPPPIDDGGTTREPIGTIDPIWEEATATPVSTSIVSTPTPTTEPIRLGTPVPPPTSNPTPTVNLQTPTPTPTIVAETSTPTPNPEVERIPLDKLAYDDMVTYLVEKNYYTNDSVPRDPVNDNSYYYGYDSDGALFELTARLESGSGEILRLTN